MAKGDLLAILGMGSELGAEPEEDPRLEAADALLEAIKAEDREGIVLAFSRLADPGEDMLDDDETEEPEDLVS